MTKKILLLLLTLSLSLSGCGIYKRSDIKDNPGNVEERVRKNIEEGRGIKFGSLGKTSGTFDFASSNEMWRASIEVLDFVSFTNASYSGGIIITDWFSSNKDKTGNKKEMAEGLWVVRGLSMDNDDLEKILPLLSKRDKKDLNCFFFYSFKRF